MNYTNEAGTISLDCNLNLSKYALDIYKELNPQQFPKSLKVPLVFYNLLKEISIKHNQEIELEDFVIDFPQITPNNKVLLAFSGGLDSVYQLLYLKEKNYDITLFHIKNMNYYTNGKEFQVVQNIAKHFNLPLVIAEFKQNTKDNYYKKYWKENSFKNTLLYSIMIDYCIQNNIQNISSGDDLRLNISDAVIGTNVSDAEVITTDLFVWLQNGIEFMPIPSNTPVNYKGIKQEKAFIHKGIRLQKLQEYHLLDEFYSCVNPGRFNQSNHNRVQKKFNINLEKYNCGVCRKCAIHSLLRYYFLHENYPQEFINYCWAKIANGADHEFFKPELSLQERINNLFNY